jgi:antitoxin component YwqK of YwqJK toxin-antitoxin module
MKKLLLIAVTILAVGCKSDGVKADIGINSLDLDNRNETYYVKDSESPYTGKAHRKYPSGKKLSEVNFKNGRMDGLQLAWHENGQKKHEVNYKNGNPFDGLTTVWHENGQRFLEENHKDGKLISGKYWNSKGESVDSFLEARK